MKRLMIVSLMFVVISGITAASFFSYYSYDEASERLFSRFADPKEEYAMLLNGQVTYQGDTVMFNFLPGVSFPINEDEEDLIIIKSGAESVEFSREMINDYNVPNPTGDGKSMKSWQVKITDCRDSDSSLLIKEKKFFKIFEKVVANGKIVYSGFETEKDLVENFQQTYGKSSSDANQLAKKFSNPIF